MVKIFDLEVRELVIDKNGLIFRPRSREKENLNPKIFTANYIDLLNVISFFHKHNAIHSISKWEIPALTLFIQKYIFKGNISKFKARELSITLKAISKMVDVF